ncbi:DUF4917 family protein [Roseospirillum parvum]|uniref:DUF4917 domain-containing protein n=1 Tax=Roseospirillum parvum TaxID=83401 RepID=A0A1G8F308_9PROT|nr:DUF4917 family protein [Roseospirillum parvum]SDH76399.1 protein of unknown function [Roseospirillum parvum]
MQTFDQAIARAKGKKHLLLGNGFSIALKPDIFTYGSLFSKADFSTAPHAEALFDALDTKDFEAVIRLLVDMERALPLYEQSAPELVEQVRQDAEALKTILANVIARNHPDRPYDIENEQYAHCRQFLANFEHIYTFNYDLLLYWSLMHNEVDELNIRCDDGFRHPEGNEDAPYVSWQDSNSPTVHFLHGALHIFDAGHELTKYTWSKTDVAIVDQIRMALDEQKYPLFVAEGHSQDKLDKIMHSAYLHKALRSFESIGGSLFVFGHSFDDNDDHVLGRIPTGKVQDLYVGIYGDPESTVNRRTIAKARRFAEQRSEIPRKRPLEIHFYDASTANVWGD